MSLSSQGYTKNKYIHVALFNTDHTIFIENGKYDKVNGQFSKSTNKCKSKALVQLPTLFGAFVFHIGTVDL